MKNMTANRWTQKERQKNQTLCAVNAGPPDTDSLYYPVNVEVVSQKCSLLPAHKR